MFRRAKQLLKNKEGNVSIIITILLLIGMTILFAMFDFSNRAWVLQEVRGIMDAAGRITLTEVVDKGYLKDEVFSVQTNQGSLSIDTTDWSERGVSLSSQVKNKIHTSYKQKLEEQVKSGGAIKGMNVLHVDSYVKYDNWGTGDASSGKSRAYLVLGSVVAVDVKLSQSYGAPLKLHSGVFESVRNDSTFTVEGVESIDSETMRIVVRSLVRVVYR